MLGLKKTEHKGDVIGTGMKHRVANGLCSRYVIMFSSLWGYLYLSTCHDMCLCLPIHVSKILAPSDFYRFVRFFAAAKAYYFMFLNYSNPNDI